MSIEHQLRRERVQRALSLGPVIACMNPMEYLQMREDEWVEMLAEFGIEDRHIKGAREVLAANADVRVRAKRLAQVEQTRRDEKARQLRRLRWRILRLAISMVKRGEEPRLRSDIIHRLHVSASMASEATVGVIRAGWSWWDMMRYLRGKYSPKARGVRKPREQKMRQVEWKEGMALCN